MDKQTRSKKYERVEKQYELGMTKLLAIAAVAILAAVLIGAFFGNKIGYASAISNVDVETPEYCNALREKGEIKIKCNELDVTADELCRVTSEKIQEQLRILVIA